MDASFQKFRNTYIILLATCVLATSPDFGLEKHGQKCVQSIFVKKAFVPQYNLLRFCGNVQIYVSQQKYDYN